MFCEENETTPKDVYIDNAATTKPLPEVVSAMQPYLAEEYGNPSATYPLATRAKDAVEESREIIASSIGAKPEEIYFTSGGTESDNWAIEGVAVAGRFKGRHIVTTQIEHHAVLHTVGYLERLRYPVTYLPVDSYGMVELDVLESSLRADTILVSVMCANNEIGTVEPIREIGKITKGRGVLLHTDAVQAYGHIPIDVNEMSIDLLSASGHKINAPKGTGFLYVREGTEIEPLLHGGGQERGMRSGTENVAGIVGLGVAAKICQDRMSLRIQEETVLRDWLIGRVLNEIPGSSLNGSTEHRLPNNAHFCFKGIESASLLMLLNMSGISASAGSACTTGSLEPSHVLKAIGVSDDISAGALRLTIGHDATIEDIDYVVEELKKDVETLRSISAVCM